MENLDAFTKRCGKTEVLYLSDQAWGVLPTIKAAAQRNPSNYVLLNMPSLWLRHRRSIAVAGPLVGISAISAPTGIFSFAFFFLFSHPHCISSLLLKM